MANEVANVAIYSCNLCPRTFTSWQALGGHQNAHRKERYTIKRLENERKMAMQAREAHFQARPPRNPGLNWSDLNGSLAHFASPPACYGLPAFGGGPIVGPRPSSSGSKKVQDETLDLTLKL